MILNSRALQGVCLLAAATVHLGGLITWTAREDTQIAATGPVAEAKIGSSFADLAMGTMTPLQVSAAAQPPQTAPLNAIEAATMAAPATIPNVAPVVAPQTTTTSPSVDTATAATPETTLAPPVDTPTTAKLITSTRRLVAMAEPDTAPVTSRRPSTRPADLAAAQSASRSGNARQDATAGTGNSNTSAAALKSGSNAATARSAAQSNASISNYRGEVLKRISSVRRPRTNARGVAVISFTIAANGSLAHVGLLRSSGSRDLDRLAEHIIRRAAPFPPPPPGADRAWQIEVADR